MTYVVSGTRFRAPRAHGACEAGFFSWLDIFFGDGSNEVSHAHGQGREVRFAEDPVRDPDRENGHYENIYILYRCRYLKDCDSFDNILPKVVAKKSIRIYLDSASRTFSPPT